MSAPPSRRELELLGDALATPGPCALCGRETPAGDIGALAVEVLAAASRRALGLAENEGATLVLAVCPVCLSVAERHPGEVVRVVVARHRVAMQQREVARWQ